MEAKLLRELKGEEGPGLTQEQEKDYYRKIIEAEETEWKKFAEAEDARIRKNIIEFEEAERKKLQAQEGHYD